MRSVRKFFQVLVPANIFLVLANIFLQKALVKCKCNQSPVTAFYLQAQLEKLQSEIAQVAKKTGIASAAKFATIQPKSNQVCTQEDIVLCK